MHARMTHPLTVLPEAMTAIQQANKAVSGAGVAPDLLELIHIRASQVNGCGACVEYGVTVAQKRGETTQRLLALASWRETPFFTERERAALALTEAATRMADRPDAVPEEIWDAAAAHFDERQLAAIVLKIAFTNAANRFNATIRQPAGTL
ncbi:carboxymuconolactone decarboxylase family protein [Spiractinospora alimapuensis]|uniref:carboxymuconolactone decarboxylase family protein n=1 Tax=Spiractinospora alimapuensis TaxID=2820884 RepID=UPI001F1ED116|nr:carboxymuconolactone decarboxylase family protein [Spiractinospora alimapuensis]QVQ52187.1 carboxymuconolactone decarboxylase family protein [Spiractinospora alimapuensis]